MAANAHRVRRDNHDSASGIAKTPNWFNYAALLSLLMVFGSGCSALIFQVIWVKQLSLVVGVDIHAVTIAVSGFFAGLAFGGWVFGNRVESHPHPFRFYSFIELAIAIVGIACTYALSQSASTFAHLENRIGVLAYAYPFFLVGIPATLIGGTVPVLLRAIVVESTPISVLGGYLYAANTAGAVVGALLVPFYLIPWLGVFDTSVFAGGINATIALVAYSLQSPVPIQTITDQSSIIERPPKFRLALSLYTIAGAIALGYELVWSQIVVQWTSTRSFAFAVVLAVYLTGIMIGSALSAPSANNCRDPWTRFGFLIVAAGTTALLQMFFLGEWLPKFQTTVATIAFNFTGSESAAMLSRFVTAASTILLLPTLLLGAAFPTALKLTTSNKLAGRNLGLILAVNTLGGIAGTFVVGFLLIPVLGLEYTLGLLAICAATIGLIAAWAAGSSARGWLRSLIIASAVTTVALTLCMGSGHLAKQWAASHKGSLLFHRAGASGTVAVIEQGTEERQFRRLYIQGVSNSGDSLTSLRYMRLQTLVPLLIHRGKTRSVLVIGLGTGITAGATLSYEGLDRRTCAELLPEVAQAVELFHGNQNVGRDPRLEKRLVDGRRELLRSSEMYDLITLEPPPPSAAGVVNLYSTDFYRLAAKRLNLSGFLAQWLPLPTQTDQDTRSLVRSFLDGFPYVTLWTTELHEMMLIGSMQPMELDVNKIALRFSQPSVAQSLREIGIDSPSALLATYVCDRSALEAYTEHARSVTDDQPRIEYGSWVLPSDFPHTLTNLLALQSSPTLLNADQTLLRSLEEKRRTLHTFYSAGVAAYNGDRSLWKSSFDSVIAREPANPYYRWFAANEATGTP